MQKTTHKVYLKYVAPDDIHIYSIDEVFIVATHYLGSFHISAHDFVMQIILDVLKTTDITATAGIGPNLYLAKVAMDGTAEPTLSASTSIKGNGSMSLARLSRVHGKKMDRNITVLKSTQTR